jgi:hypothetical protein
MKGTKIKDAKRWTSAVSEIPNILWEWKLFPDFRCHPTCSSRKGSRVQVGSKVPDIP